jgi:hypothetical protein
VSWGIDLATEHERFLTEDLFKQPVIVYDYPKEIKAFYMKLNEDGKTVAAMDVLVPKVGEGREQFHQVRCEVPCAQRFDLFDGKTACCRDGRAGVRSKWAGEQFHQVRCEVPCAQRFNLFDGKTACCRDGRAGVRSKWAGEQFHQVRCEVPCAQRFALI